MKKIIFLAICLYLGGIIMSFALDKTGEFKLMSKTLKHNETLSNKQTLNAYGCNGGNVSPDLSWFNAPNKTKSFAIICHDPDAPKENGWYHWIVLNIPNNINSVDEGGKIENSLETVTDFNSVGYGGACPPIGHGIHHYNFTIYALDVEKLNINPNTKPYLVEKEVLKHMIKKDTITGLFERR